MVNIDVSERMKEIIDEYGLKNSDFYFEPGLADQETDSSKVAKARYFKNLNGKVKLPSFDFVTKFCQQAGISIGTFCKEEPQVDLKITNDEKRVIEIYRALGSKEKKNHVLSYLELIKGEEKK